MSAEPAPIPTPTPEHDGTSETAVTVTATTSDGSPVDGVLVTFGPTAAGSSLGFNTDSSGRFTAQLPTGTYEASCVVLAGTCQWSGTKVSTGRLEVGSGPMSLGLDVVLDDLPFGESASSSESNDASNDDSNSGTDNTSAPSVSGHVRTPGGQPVAGITVEHKNLTGGNVNMETDSNGYYAFTLPADTYNALCVVDLEKDDNDECGVQGTDGSAYPVSVPPDGQTVDFIICPLDQYPACLNS